MHVLYFSFQLRREKSSRANAFVHQLADVMFDGNALALSWIVAEFCGV
jgi:hypothetical protein